MVWVASEFTWRPCGIMQHNNNNTTLATRQSARERFSKHSMSARATVLEALSVYDARYGNMVGINACMLGRTGRSAACLGPHSHLLNTTTPAVSLNLPQDFPTSQWRSYALFPLPLLAHKADLGHNHALARSSGKVLAMLSVRCHALAPRPLRPSCPFLGPSWSLLLAAVWPKARS